MHWKWIMVFIIHHIVK